MATTAAFRAEAEALLRALTEQADAEDAADPHVLLVTDPETHHSYTTGPFANRMTARAMIAVLAHRWLREIGEPVASFVPIRFVPYVFPTYPE